MTIPSDPEILLLSLPETLDLRQVLSNEVRITLHLTGPGGGIWTIDTDAVPALRRGDSRLPDSRLRCTVEDFQALMEGRLAPRRGFIEGRLQVEGDVGLIIRLQRALMVFEELDIELNV